MHLAIENYSPQHIRSRLGSIVASAGEPCVAADFYSFGICSIERRLFPQNLAGNRLGFHQKCAVRRLLASHYLCHCDSGQRAGEDEYFDCCLPLSAPLRYRFQDSRRKRVLD